jgi:hypothetical protein
MATLIQYFSEFIRVRDSLYGAALLYGFLKRNDNYISHELEWLFYKDIVVQDTVAISLTYI